MSNEEINHYHVLTVNNFASIDEIKRAYKIQSLKLHPDKNRDNIEEATKAFDALKKSDYDPKGKFFLERFISAHSIMISFEGVPAIYFNSLFGTSNDETKYIITGNNRDLNRYRWNHNNITEKLKDIRSKQSIFYKSITNLLKEEKSAGLNNYKTYEEFGKKGAKIIESIKIIND